MSDVKRTSIFTTSIDNEPMPQPNYFFKVVFDGSDLSGETVDFLTSIANNDKCISYAATLPKSTTKTVTQWYRGTPMTRIVNQDRSGDTNLEFIINRGGLGELKTLFDTDGYTLDEIDVDEFEHFEFSRSFSKIYIYLLASNAYEPSELLSDENITAKYTLYNCVVTSLDFGNLSYDGNEMVKLAVTVHYDYWSID